MDYFKVVLIDDGSVDGTGEYVKQHFPFVIMVTGDGNLWWSGGINKGAAYAISNLNVDYVLLWNNDITTHDNYFVNLLKLIQNEDNNTIIGSKIYMNYENRTIWSMGGFINPYIGKMGMIGYNEPDCQNYQKSLEVDWIPGMGTAIPVGIINKIGFWDNIHFPQYHGDSEFTYRAKINGYKLIVSPDLILSNDVSNTAISHDGNFRKLMKLFNDRRSLYNFRVTTAFLKKYGKGPFKYFHLFKSYVILILSFLLKKCLSIIKTKR
jgi:GT2 family glycosyltransferase